jgi:hypothetical protein
MKTIRLAVGCAIFGLSSVFDFSAQAQLTTISDSTGDINAGISTGGGTLDLVKMEVGDTANDVVLKLTVNGNIATTDWGNFMIGIANQKVAGTTTGNGWNRPINLNAGVTNGMTHWIGSWVGGGGGAQLWTYSAGAWSGPVSLSGISLNPTNQSVITYTVPKTSLGVVDGDTIRLDAYSSGGGGSDSAVDALANPSTSITSWGQTYTSSGANLASYTLASTMLNTTQTISFSVNMSHQVVLGTFNPATDAVTVDWGTGFPQANFVYLTDGDSDGVYTGSATISAPEGSSVPYRFTIEPGDINQPLLSENLSPLRTFPMPGSGSTVGAAYFNNIEGYRDVTFTVNMSVQETLGNFNPATQTVEVRGPFNGWAGTTLTAQGSGIYSGTVRISGAAGPVIYKFYAGSYEGISGNRNFTLAFNPGGAATPAQVLDTVFYNDVNTVPAFRPVTFAVNMSRQISLTAFNPATDFVEIRGDMNGWGGGTAWRLADGDSDGIYTGTFNITGAEGASVPYKFHNSAAGAANSGYESTPNRTVTLGPVQTAQTATTVFFNNDSGQTRQVTFAVDLSIQEQLGNFNPATGIVQLRGLGGFGDAEAQALTREGTTLIYSGTFPVPGDAGSDFAYKFWATGPAYEVVNPADLFQNRAVTLGVSGTPQTVATAFFNNQSAVPPSALFYLPASVIGTVGTAISSLTPTVTGTVTNYSVNPALPLGLSIDASSGVISGTPTAVTASASYTVTAANAGGSTTASVTLAVAAAISSGSTFSGWAGSGTATNSELVGKYGIGGATNSSAASEQPVAAVDSTTLFLSAIVRTNDPKVEVVGEAGDSLTNLSTNGVTVTASTNTNGVPEGHQRQVFSVDRTNSPTKQFLRLKATLAP